MKLDLRKYLPKYLASNNLSYSTFRPRFYADSLFSFKSFVSKFPNIQLESLTVKKAYKLLLAEICVPLRIINIFPEIDLPIAFVNTANKFLSPDGRDVSFRILHHILLVNDYLFSMGIVKNPFVYFL